jgi:hypothetical protein
VQWCDGVHFKLRNVGTLLQHYTVSQSRATQPEIKCEIR